MHIDKSDDTGDITREAVIHEKGSHPVRLVLPWLLLCKPSSARASKVGGIRTARPAMQAQLSPSIAIQAAVTAIQNHLLRISNFHL